MQSKTRVGFCDDIGGGTIHNCRFVNLTVTENMQAACKVKEQRRLSLCQTVIFVKCSTTSGVATFQFIYGQTKVERMRFVECHPNPTASSALIIANRTVSTRPNLPTWYTETADDNPVISNCWFEGAVDEGENEGDSVTDIWSTSNMFAIRWEGTANDRIRQTPDIVIDAEEGLDEEFCWMREKGCRTMSETINDRTSGKFKGHFPPRKLSLRILDLDLSSVDFSPHFNRTSRDLEIDLLFLTRRVGWSCGGRKNGIGQHCLDLRKQVHRMPHTGRRLCRTQRPSPGVPNSVVFRGGDLLPFRNFHFLWKCFSHPPSPTAQVQSCSVSVYARDLSHLSITSCRFENHTAAGRMGIVRLTGIYETNPAQATITECGKMGLGSNASSVEEVGGEGGEDSVMCGHPDRKCATLRHATTLCRATEGTENLISVIVGEGEHSEETITVGRMRIGVRGRWEKSETKLRSQDGTRLMTLGDGLLSRLLTIVLPSLSSSSPTISSSGTLSITSVSFMANENQPTLSTPIISIAAGSATLDSCDLPALLFSNKEAFITVASEGTLLFKSVNCDFNDASSDSLISSFGSVELVDYSLSNIDLASSLLRDSGDLSLRGCTFTSLLDSAHSEDSSHIVDATIGKDNL
ncbi:hypothetical protein BLNAU_19479 [Blattamonas nauphoetae]|uniref:Right handed beta helix domain-containing protein n=1 Tax=Blattamonas nauphoetae TaxID=2049346 RepID=A0ABQ9X2P6_9EUKA|nr:hypothetical protein BLNAU_19479 [Blattamonas nauphoetae]